MGEDIEIVDIKYKTVMRPFEVFIIPLSNILIVYKTEK